MTDMKRQSVSLPDELVEAIETLKTRIDYTGTDSGLYRRLLEVGLRTLDINPDAIKPKREARLSSEAISIAESFDHRVDDLGRKLIKQVVAHEVSRQNTGN